MLTYTVAYAVHVEGSSIVTPTLLRFELRIRTPSSWVHDSTERKSGGPAECCCLSVLPTSYAIHASRARFNPETGLPFREYGMIRLRYDCFSLRAKKPFTVAVYKNLYLIWNPTSLYTQRYCAPKRVSPFYCRLIYCTLIPSSFSRNVGAVYDWFSMEWPRQSCLSLRFDVRDVLSSAWSSITRNAIAPVAASLCPPLSRLYGRLIVKREVGQNGVWYLIRVTRMRLRDCRLQNVLGDPTESLFGISSYQVVPG